MFILHFSKYASLFNPSLRVIMPLSVIASHLGNQNQWKISLTTNPRIFTRSFCNRSRLLKHSLKAFKNSSVIPRQLVKLKLIFLREVKLCNDLLRWITPLSVILPHLKGMEYWGILIEFYIEHSILIFCSVTKFFNKSPICAIPTSDKRSQLFHI